MKITEGQLRKIVRKLVNEQVGSPPSSWILSQDMKSVFDIRLVPRIEEEVRNHDEADYEDGEVHYYGYSPDYDKYASELLEVALIDDALEAKFERVTGLEAGGEGYELFESQINDWITQHRDDIDAWVMEAVQSISDDMKDERDWGETIPSLMPGRL